MQNPLYRAVEQGDLAEVRRLLAEGVPVDVRGPQGSTPLIHAALYGQAEVVRLLLQHGADPDARCETGHNALIMAGSFDHQPVIDLLIASGATVGLIEAATLGDTAALERLLDGGAEVDYRNEMDTTALIQAAHNGRLTAAELLVNRGASLNAPARYGWTALMKALHAGHGEVARLLIQGGAEVAHRDESGGTALHCAVMGYRSGARPYRDPDLLTHFLMVEEELLDLIRLLVRHGADVNARSDNGGTALEWAESMGERRTGELLRSLGAA